MRIFTIGHSVRPIDETLAMLRAFDVATLVDVRTVPRSRRHPQYDREALARSLEEAGVAYVHTAALGGLRHARKDSKNLAWRNESFRGYADHMETAAFRAALVELIDRAATTTTCVMCAEAVPWRCHRSLIADALVARGVDVSHIMSPTKATPHKLTPFARVDDGLVSYPALL